MLLAILAAGTMRGGMVATPFNMTGRYVEGCACPAPCLCEMTGLVMGCEGVGTFEFTSGDVGGVSIANCRGAYATVPGKWVILYIDAPNADQRKAVERMMRYALDGFGKVEAVRSAKITLSGSAGNFKTTVGSYYTLSSKPMTGGDGKTPLRYGNLHDRVHPDVMGGTTVACSFKDGSRNFKLKGTNAFFNENLAASGNL